MTEEHAHEPNRDTAWIRVQKKTFTRWCNNFLKDRKMFIQDLEHDLETGLHLINLLEIISNKNIGAKYNKAPKMKPQKLENVGICLKFIEQQKIKLVAIGPEDIIDGNLKLILGLIWTLILRFQIQRGDFSGKAELLEWVRQQVAPYGLRPNNFSVDWVDGKVLSALTDSLKKGVFPQGDWTGNAINDINKAQGIAETEYTIPRLIDPEDIVECPDELAMMTYISYFRDWFLDDAKRRSAEIEAERLRKMRTADPSQCYAHGPGTTHATTNNLAPFQIQSVNYFGDPLPTGGDEFVIQLSGPSGAHVDVHSKDNGNGTYDCGYTPVDIGKYKLNITLRGDGIKNNPYSPVTTGPDSKKHYCSRTRC
jgi:filamin